MMRIQIRLTEGQFRKLRALAGREVVSVAELVRRFVDQGLEKIESNPLELYTRAKPLIGRFVDREDATDLAARHDRYLTEAKQ